MEKIFAFLVLFISVIANFIKFEKPSTEPSVLDEAIIEKIAGMCLSRLSYGRKAEA